MASRTWSLSTQERITLERALDALLPPSGSFPVPSQTGLIDDFIMLRVPEKDDAGRLYPGLDAPRLKALLSSLQDAADMTESLTMLQQEQPEGFQQLWSLAIYGYYSRSETIAAIQRDLAPAYHGAPLPRGYVDAMPPWDASDPLQMPRSPRGSHLRTEQVRRVDTSKLTGEGSPT